MWTNRVLGEFSIYSRRQTEIEDTQRTLKGEVEADQSIPFNAEQVQVDRYDGNLDERKPSSSGDIAEDIQLERSFRSWHVAVRLDWKTTMVGYHVACRKPSL